MAEPTLGTVATDSNASSGSLTFAVTTSGNNRYLLVAAMLRPGDPDNRTVTGVTFNGSAMTLVDSQDSAPTSPPRARVYWYQAIAPAATTANVIVSFSGDGQNIAYAFPFSDVDQTTPHGTVSKAGASGTGPSLNVTTDADKIIIDVLGLSTFEGEGATTATAGGSQTDFCNLAPGASLRGCGSRRTGTGSQATSWTLSVGEDYAHMAMTVNGIAAAGGNANLMVGKFGAPLRGKL